MPLSNATCNSFERSFALFRDLLETLDESTLGRKLPGLASNTVGAQFWCVIGARESYARAIAEGKWKGFSCSLQSLERMRDVRIALDRSEQQVHEILTNLEAYSAKQCRLLIDLLEHEAAHQGQLIRYLYGLGLTAPSSWKQRYALT